MNIAKNVWFVCKVYWINHNRRLMMVINQQEIVETFINIYLTVLL
jgi:hypothetical protein